MADEIHDEIDDLPAEPIELRRFDMHSAWRVLLWGASAAMAVAIVAGTAFSDVGAERLKQTVAALFDQTKTDTPQQPATQQVAQQTTPQTTAPEVTLQQFAALEKQTRELTQTVRDLTTDRDRLKAKLASVEQSLDDITGAIRKQTAQTTAQPAAPQPSRTAQTAPPVISAPQTVAAIPSPSANPAIAAPDTPVTTAVPSSPTIEASPPLDGPIPLPPTRVAALDESAATFRELGIDVGGATSLDALRAHWSGLKANVGPDIVGLLPSFTVRQKPAGGSDYRLVLGPFPNSTTALRICAKLIAARVNCRAGSFAVQRLADTTPVQPRAVERQLPSVPAEAIISR